MQLQTQPFSLLLLVSQPRGGPLVASPFPFFRHLHSFHGASFPPLRVVLPPSRSLGLHLRWYAFLIAMSHFSKFCTTFRLAGWPANRSFHHAPRVP
jgi:hypothetical protein